MKVLVTGATGFVGNHVIQKLLSNGHQVVATSTNVEKAKAYNWFKQVQFRQFSLDTTTYSDDLYEFFYSPGAVIHLAWQGLPNYKSSQHIENNLFTHFFFLKNLLEGGLKNLTVTGTCLEYGMQNGPLHEGLDALPNNPYALAKDSLRRLLESLIDDQDFSFKWVRLFYMYGEGQNPKSILSLLQKAIENGETEFKMSGGEQLRDYLPVSDVAQNIVAIALQEKITGVINCCSGQPISIRRLVENYLHAQNSQMKLCLGHYPYPDYEPMAFWGDATKLRKIIS